MHAQSRNDHNGRRARRDISKVLEQIDELKELELQKGRTARNSDEFHDLAVKVVDAARHVFDTAGRQLIEGDQESPIPDERDEQHPGDWTEESRI